jgi:glycosyltransferase involved in cell wall biosynthesis
MGNAQSGIKLVLEKISKLQMAAKILFIERKLQDGISIEKVFRQIAKSLTRENFIYSFQQLQYCNSVLGTLKNLLFFKYEENDIYHITGHVHYMSLILPVENTVLTIHDLGILRIRRGLRRFVLKKILFDLPLRRLKYITTISTSVKNEIVYYTQCDESKIRVIENPLQEHFFLSAKKTFNSQCPTILQIGTTQNKNLENLIKALSGIVCRLKIIGKLEENILSQLKAYKINYENACNLNDEEIKAEYQNADIVAFCSLYEGFGLPIIEAQAMRTPVITSNISPLKEVAGGGAVLVNPNDFASIKKGLESLLGNKILRENLIEKGIENIKRFEAKHISLSYEKLYKEIVRQNSQRI